METDSTSLVPSRPSAIQVFLKAQQALTNAAGDLPAAVMESFERIRQLLEQLQGVDFQTDALDHLSVDLMNVILDSPLPRDAAIEIQNAVFREALAGWASQLAKGIPAATVAAEVRDVTKEAPAPEAPPAKPAGKRGPGRPKGSGNKPKSGGASGGSKKDKPKNRRPLEDPSDVETDADKKVNPELIVQLAKTLIVPYQNILLTHNTGSSSPFDMTTFTKMSELGQVDPVLANKLKYLPLVFLASNQDMDKMEDEAAFLNAIRQMMRQKNYRLALAEAFCEAFELNKDEKLGSVQSAFAYLAPKLRPADWWDRVAEYSGVSFDQSPAGEGADDDPDAGTERGARFESQFTHARRKRQW